MVAGDPVTAIGTGRRWPRTLLDSPLWRNVDFRRLWAGQAVSQLGTQVTLVAIPLIAIGTLHANTGQVGVLSALSRLPFLLYLVAGVWVDRTRRRPVLIGTDLARGVLVLLVPLAAVTGLLSYWLLCAVVVVSTALSVWFDIGYMSYLPSLVGRDGLLAANTRLETTRATTQVVGPSVGGVLVQVLTGPVAMIVDGLSYFVAAVFAVRIRAPEPAPSRRSGGPAGPRGPGTLRAELAEGFGFVFRHPMLASLALAIGVSNFAWAAELAQYLIFLVHGVGLPAALVGVTLAGQGPGTLVGSALAGRIQKWFGLAGAICGGLLLFAAAALLIPLAPGTPALAVPVLVGSGFLMALGGQVCAVNVLTSRQRVTPDRLQGRVNATFRFLALGVSPVGSLAGGYAGQALGLRTGLYLAIALMFLAPAIVLLSPVRRIRAVPPDRPDAGQATP